jgi:hypothetical protein
LPCKIVIAFVETKAKLGDYHTNPFNLRRKWFVQKTDSTEQIELPFSARERYLEERLAQIEEQFKKFQETQKSDKTGQKKGKGFLIKSQIDFFST